MATRPAATPPKPLPTSLTKSIRPASQYAGTPPTPPAPSESLAVFNCSDCHGAPLAARSAVLKTYRKPPLFPAAVITAQPLGWKTTGVAPKSRSHGAPPHGNVLGSDGRNDPCTPSDESSAIMRSPYGV